jgi:hypothetical protein
MDKSESIELVAQKHRRILVVCECDGGVFPVIEREVCVEFDLSDFDTVESVEYRLRGTGMVVSIRCDVSEFVFHLGRCEDGVLGEQAIERRWLVVSDDSETDQRRRVGGDAHHL